MSDFDRYFYVSFMPSAEMREVASFDAAIRLIRSRYPHAYHGREWQSAPMGTSLPVWADAGVSLRCELGEKQHECRPVAYVHQSHVRLDLAAKKE